MESIGEKLRRERLRRGLDLYEIAEQTKINPSLLEVIEAGDVEKLPGGFLTRSFVRQYAKSLGLDESEFESDLAQMTAAETPPLAEEVSRERSFEVPPVRGSSRSYGQHSFGSLIAFILIVAACSAVYVLWQRTRQPGREETTAPSESVKQQSAAQPQPPPPAVQPSPAALVPGSEATAGPGTQSGSTAAPAQPAAPLSTLPTGTPAPMHIEIRANSPAWVRVRADGQDLFSGTIQTGQSRSFEGAKAMNVRTGNAGGIDVTVNGTPIGKVGPEGQIRTIEVTPGEPPRVMAPAPKPPVEEP